MKEFIVNDFVYGKHIFEKPVIIELINTSAIQRLKKINQLGPPKELHYSKGFF